MRSRKRSDETPSRTRRLPSQDGPGADNGPYAADLSGSIGNRATMSALGAAGVQRKCKECEDEDKELEQVQRATEPGAAEAPERPSPDEERPAGPAGARTALIVDDDSRTLAPEQMRKSEFLRALSAQASGLESMGGQQPVSGGSGEVERWLGYFGDQPAGSLEDAIHRAVPETEGAPSARDYLRIIGSKARSEVGDAARTGEAPEFPEISGFGSAGSLLPGLSFKEGGGGGPAAASPSSTSNPASVGRQLGPGRALDSSVRGSMETAFGRSFAGVRLHTDVRAAELSDALHARAFTVGEHVAFGPGEYKPDSTVGQALIAHELAHVVQQAGAATVGRESRQGQAALEEQADTSAVRAVMSLSQGNRRGLADVRANAIPRLKSGLRLHRCSCGRKDPKPSPKPEIPLTQEAVGNYAASCVKLTARGGSKSSGLWYAFQYKRAYPGDWEADYASGYADPDYWERVSSMHWRLKARTSASAAVKKWFDGLTIAECLSTSVAIQVNTVRAAIGDARFDELFGSEDQDTLPIARLHMGVRGSNALERVQEAVATPAGGDVGVMGKRPAKVGDWHYFRNYPKYLLKHPGGVFQGENAFLLEDPPAGPQIWGGFGLPRLTERAMLESMARDYNRARDEWDNEALARIKAHHGGTLPPQYDPASKTFPDRISVEEIPGAEYEYTDPFKGNTTKFVGGFRPGTGKTISAEKIKGLLEKEPGE